MKKFKQVIALVLLGVMMVQTTYARELSLEEIYKSKARAINELEEVVIGSYEIADFNNDGIKDLYIIELATDYKSGKHVIFTYKNGKLTRLAEQPITKTANSDNTMYYLCANEIRTAYMFEEVLTETSGNTIITTQKRYGFVNNKFVERVKCKTFTVADTGKINSKKFYKDGKECTELEYIKLANLYDSRLLFGDMAFGGVDWDGNLGN